MHGPCIWATHARVHAHAFPPAASPTALCSLTTERPVVPSPGHRVHLSLHLSLSLSAPPHRRTALPSPPHSARSLAPLLTNPNPNPGPDPNPNQAKAGWLAGHDPDEESSLDLLPPEWRWQSGGAQHGAGTGAVRAAPLQRPPVTHSDCQLASPSLAAPSQATSIATARRARTTATPCPSLPPTHFRARHTKRARRNEPSRFCLRQERQHYFNSLSRLHADQHPVLGYVRSTRKLCLPEEAMRG